MNKKGFSLLELTVAIALVGLLVAIVLPNLNGTRKKSRDAIRAEDLKSLSQAAELYFAEHDYRFPSALSDLAGYYTEGVLPKDPLTDASYLYMTTSNPREYCIGAVMEVMTGGSSCVISGATYTIKGP